MRDVALVWFRTYLSPCCSESFPSCILKLTFRKLDVKLRLPGTYAAKIDEMNRPAVYSYLIRFAKRHAGSDRLVTELLPALPL